MNVLHTGAAESAAAKSDPAAGMFSACDGYELFMGRWSRRLAPAFLAFTGARDGDRVLDVGCGTGALAAAVAAALPASAVTGVDPSAAFVDHAAAQVRSARVRFEVGDAQALAFGDGVFDHVMSMLVLNFVPDHHRALGQMRRVARPGGVVSACVWDYGAGMQMLRFFWDAAVALDARAEPKDERHMKVTGEGQLAALWNQAGLAKIQEGSLLIEQTFASFADYWAPFLMATGPAGAYVATLDDGRRAQLEARLRARVLGAGADGAFTLQARAWCVRGEVAMPG
jgi:SAM-dependent methyltransferase